MFLVKHIVLKAVKEYLFHSFNRLINKYAKFVHVMKSRFAFRITLQHKNGALPSEFN